MIESKTKTTEDYKKFFIFAKKNMGIDQKQLENAINSLKEYNTTLATKSHILLKDDYIYLTFSLSEVPSNHTCRPLQINLPHPIYTEQFNNEICFIVKDPQSDWKQEVENAGLQNIIKKVIGVSHLMKKFSTFEKKRLLINSFDAFLCDIRVYKMLPKCLGREFYRKKKFPAPIKLKDPSSDLKKAINATYIMMGNGPHYSLKVARTRMETKEVLNNVIRVIQRVIPYFLLTGIKLKDIQCISLKSEETPDLPFYSHLSKSEAMSYILEKIK